MFRFYLYHADRGEYTRIKDPVGWNSLGKTIKRDMNWHGIFFEYTPKLRFVKDGKEFVKYYYEKYGIEAVILLKITKRNSATGKYEEDYIGRLNLTVYRVGTIYAECNVESTSQLLQKIQNRRDVKVDLANLVSLGGKAITPFANESYTIPLHSKSLRFLYRQISSNSVSGVAINNGTYYLMFDTFTHGATLDIDEIEQRFNLHTQISSNHPVTFSKYCFKAKFGGNYRFKFDFHYILGGLNTHNYQVQWVLTYGKEGDYTTVNIGTADNVTNTSMGADKSLDTTITLNANDEVYYYATLAITGGADNIGLSVGSISLPLEQYLITITADTTTPVSTNNVQLWHEAWTRVLQSITDTADPFRSNFYGRTDSEPVTYAEDGPGSLKAEINGHLLRGNSKPLYSTLKELFDASMAMDGVGMTIEKSNGVERVRVEKLTYFYQAKRLMRLDYIKDVEKAALTEMYANELDNGNEVWTNNKTTNNDEVNGKRSWTFPTTQLKKKIVLRNPYIASGSLLETVRRLSVDPSKDTDYDTSNFVIQLRRNAGFEPDRDQDFSSVTGINDSSSAYNLKLSPKRCLKNNGRAIRAFLEKYKDQFIKFSFGDGNTGMSTRLTTETADVVESADQLISELDKPLFLPEVYNITAKLTRQQLVDLQTTDPDADANVWQFIEFSTTNKDYKRGYLLEAKLSPDSNECQLRLIRANV